MDRVIVGGKCTIFVYSTLWGIIVLFVFWGKTGVKSLGIKHNNFLYRGYLVLNRKKFVDLFNRNFKNRFMKFSKEAKEKALIEIFARIAKGEALVKICSKERARHLPSYQMFNEWLNIERAAGKSDIIVRYELANTERQDYMAQQILEISDEATNDKITVDGRELTNHEAINRSRLRVDARKWLLSKMNPKRFGDKVDVTTAGEKVSTSTAITLSIDSKDITLQ